jgi:hypothetical protein
LAAFLWAGLIGFPPAAAIARAVTGVVGVMGHERPIMRDHALGVIGFERMGRMIAGRRALLAVAAGVAAWSLGAIAEAQDRAALLATLVALEKESWQFVKDRNIAGQQDYMADDGLYIFGDGSRFTKPEFLKFMPDFRLDSITIEPNADIKILTPDVATLIYRVTYTSGVKDGKAATLKVMSSSTYVRRSGKWWSVLYQETPAP